MCQKVFNCYYNFQKHKPITDIYWGIVLLVALVGHLHETFLLKWN